MLLSNLKQLFAKGQEFTYSVDTSRATTGPTGTDGGIGTRCCWMVRACSMRTS